jgi:hypothetical protein
LIEAGFTSMETVKDFIADAIKLARLCVFSLLAVRAIRRIAWPGDAENFKAFPPERLQQSQGNRLWRGASFPTPVIPWIAGIQYVLFCPKDSQSSGALRQRVRFWIPAIKGMTRGGCGLKKP